MKPIDAIMIIEGEEDATLERTLEAWASLIKDGTVWSLQGFYGRIATTLIEGGIISKDGELLKTVCL